MQWLGPRQVLPSSVLGRSGGDGPGDAHAFAPLLRRLQSGLPINVLALGSSIVGVHGGCTAAAPVLNSTGQCVCPRCCGSRCGFWGDQGWARSVLELINTTHPHPGHRLWNLGEPGGTLIPAIAACPQTYLPEDEPLHLVLLDPSTSQLKSTEGLLRHLLRRAPEPPVVMLVGFVTFLRQGSCDKSRSPWVVSNDTVTVGSLIGLTRANPAPTRIAEHGDWRPSISADASLVERAVRLLEGPTGNGYRRTLTFYRHALAAAALGRRYRLPSVQLFDALALAFETGELDLCSYSADGLHPLGPQASRIVSELIVHRLQQGLGRAVALDAPSARVTSSSLSGPSPPPLPPTLLLPRCEQREGLLCFTFDRDGYEVARLRGDGPRSEVGRKKALLVALHGNPSEPVTAFRVGGSLPTIVANEGWEFIDFEASSNTPHKPGIFATQPGARLRLSLQMGGARTPTITLQHLASYEGMGAVRATCHRCRCAEATIDAHRPRVRASLLAPATLPLTASRADSKCIVELLLLNRFDSCIGKACGQRFKLVRVIVEDLAVSGEAECAGNASRRDAASTTPAVSKSGGIVH